MIDGNKQKTVQLNNRKLVIDFFLQKNRPLTIADILASIDLSKTTILKITDYLCEKRIVLTSGKAESTSEGGRKPLYYQFNARFSYCVVFHVFPDELYSVITDLTSKILHSHSIPLHPDISLEEVLDLIVNSVDTLVKSQKVTRRRLAGIAIGSHGLTDAEKGTTNVSPHFKNWPKDYPVKARLQALLPEVPYIIIDNQIRYQVLSEKLAGCATLKKNIIVIEAGIGLVAGIIVKDEIKRGAHSFAGEIGHMILDKESSEICACGAAGCFEAMVTVSRMVRMAYSLRSQFPESSLFRLPGKAVINETEIFDAANNQDRLAQTLVDEISSWFALGIINSVLMYDPDMIVIQGIYSKGGQFFLDSIRRNIYRLSPILENIDVELALSNLGKDRSVIGASNLIVKHYLQELDVDI